MIRGLRRVLTEEPALITTLAAETVASLIVFDVIDLTEGEMGIVLGAFGAAVALIRGIVQPLSKQTPI